MGQDHWISTGSFRAWIRTVPDVAGRFAVRESINSANDGDGNVDCRSSPDRVHVPPRSDDSEKSCCDADLDERCKEYVSHFRCSYILWVISKQDLGIRYE